MAQLGNQHVDFFSVAIVAIDSMWTFVRCVIDSDVFFVLFLKSVLAFKLF